MCEGPQNSRSAADLARSAWTEIVTFLEERKKRLYEEIRFYPTPIAGCDQQFNYLLERQASVSNELAQTHEALKEVAHEQNPLATVSSFLESSLCMDDATRQRIRDRL